MRERNRSDARECATLTSQTVTLKIAGAVRSLGFAFNLTVEEFGNLKSQIVTSSSHGRRRKMPWEPVTKES